MMAAHFLIADDLNIVTLRNFYGTLRVYDGDVDGDGKSWQARAMRHGSTVHGFQILDKTLSKEPTAYHAKTGPLGDIFATLHPRKVAVLGEGVGVINCYNAPDREFTYFEIDPAVIEVADKYFTFLSACKSKTQPRILAGDARLELSKLKNEKFDLLIMDAFTSDSIPTHLITKEAFALYLEHLAPNGVIAVNISNRYFNLWDTISVTTATLGLKSVFGIGVKTKLFYASDSMWMAVARSQDTLNGLGKRWHPVAAAPGVKPWTDNYSDLFSTLALTRKTRVMR
jgi:spermidine synthase